MLFKLLLRLLIAHQSRIWLCFDSIKPLRKTDMNKVLFVVKIALYTPIQGKLAKLLILWIVV